MINIEKLAREYGYIKPNMAKAEAYIFTVPQLKQFAEAYHAEKQRKQENETSSLGANKTDPMWCYENYEASAECIDQQAQEIAELKEKLQCYKEESVAEIVSLNKVCLELKSKVVELQNENLKQYKYTSELQAHINVLREALEYLIDQNSTVAWGSHENKLEAINNAQEALATTPAQSLQAHDNEVKEVKCKTHPDAPHGFNRNESHSAGRYVCDCEFWEEH